MVNMHHNYMHGVCEQSVQCVWHVWWLALCGLTLSATPLYWSEQQEQQAVFSQNPDQSTRYTIY